MNLGITGASGFVGRALINEIEKRDDRREWRIVGFSRSAHRQIPGADEVRELRLHSTNGDSSLPDIKDLDALVNLAGENIFGLWTAKKKQRMLDSRVHITRALVQAASALPMGERPRVLVSASGIDLYGDHGDEVVTEDSSRAGADDDFLAVMGQAWEAEACRAQELDIRTCLLRISPVLGQGGGPFPKLRLPFQLGLGGNLGSGRQWMPWITVTDLSRLIIHCLEHADLNGVINAAAPQPVRNAEFTRVLARLFRRPAFFHVPAFALKLALGELAEVVLGSTRAISVRLKDSSFRWLHEEIEPALRAVAHGETL